jgi:DinB superfamily
MPTATQLESAIERIKFARQYTSRFLDDLSAEDWFWQPSQFTTHVAWQVGHLAVAQYNLCLRRVRDRIDADHTLISDSFIELYRFGSTPLDNRSQYMAIEEIRHVFDAVHQQAISELSQRSDADLDVPVERPHAAFTTKLGAVEWCAPHEMLHAGQIGLLRRLMGKPPLR